MKSELVVRLRGRGGEHTLSSDEGTPEGEIVMAEGDYSSEPDTLKLMK